MENPVVNLISNLKRRNISGFYAKTISQAKELAESFIPKNSCIGISGSKTLDELGIVASLEARGNKVFNQYKSGISAKKNLEERNLGAQADYYLTSVNAISEKGELVFFSGYGHRISGIANAKNVIVICGLNKITLNLEEALKRSREYATVLNCKRLNWPAACLAQGVCRKEICFAPDYKRMCCQILIIESEINPDRVKIVFVGEKLGF
ncbi:MAG: lactate utilization protein [Candidatus Omnitrophota bacterium]